MSTRFRCFKMEVWILLGFCVREAALAQEGIVQRIDEQCGDADVVQELFGAAGRPIFFRIVETVYGRGIPVVELLETADGGEVFQGDLVWIACCFADELGAEGAHEAPHVERVVGFLQFHGTVFQIAWHGDGHGGMYDGGNLVAPFSHVFQSNVAAQ